MSKEAVTSRKNSLFNSHFYTRRRAPRQQCPRGSAGKPRLSAFGAFLRLRELWGKKGGADGSSDHPTTSRHFLGLLPPLPLSQSRKIDDRPTVRESNLPKFSTEQQPYNFFIDGRWYYDRILVL